MAGRPSHNPTERTRGEVSALAGFGTKEDDIAAYLGIAPKTLRKHYSVELRTGHVKTNAAVAKSLYKQAIAGNVSAAIFFLKTRAGWRENPGDETEDNAPPPTKFEITVKDARKPD